MGEAKRKKLNATHRRNELQTCFERLQIDVSVPGFYDEAAFLVQEKRNPRFLECYAEWVLHRERTSEYETHVKNVLTKIAPIITARLDRHQWMGSCIAVTSMLTQNVRPPWGMEHGYKGLRNHAKS